MKHRVTVWANRNQVYCGCHNVIFANFTKQFEMMHVDEAFGKFTITFFECHLTDFATNAELFYALFASAPIALKSVHLCNYQFAFDKCPFISNIGVRKHRSWLIDFM